MITASLVVVTACQLNPSGEVNNPSEIYTEQHRPQFHFSPDSMWMNDPNGMVYYEEEYHLFYQYHPYDVVWGPMHWGHAVSPDLIHWKHFPIALYPDSLGTIFSGSAVIDRENTSGLGSKDHPPMVAIFTQHNAGLKASGSKQFEVQSIAYSLDKGRTWTKYHANPVLQNPGIPDFRDPKVIWFEKELQWLMVLAAHDRIMFYTSPDLINWSWKGKFGENTGAHGGVWECPDFFEMEANGKKKWVLLVSINPGGPNGGSGTQYFVGEFDGVNFLNENPGKEPQWLDYGKDNYAGVTWSDIPENDGRRIFLGWMSNWQYANSVPTNGWRSAMTLPRELKLEYKENQYRLVSNTVSETAGLRQERINLESGPLSGSIEVDGISDFPSSQYEVEIDFEVPSRTMAGTALEFGMILSNGRDQRFITGINLENSELFIDRTTAGKVGFSEHFPGIHTAPFQMSETGVVRFHVFIDRSSIELFLDNGSLVMTEIFFPDEDFSRIEIYAKKGSVNLKNGVITKLNGIW